RIWLLICYRVYPSIFCSFDCNLICSAGAHTHIEEPHDSINTQQQWKQNNNNNIADLARVIERNSLARRAQIIEKP
ncbi:hypothetical protein M5D96_007505, partial [Drosophila gunungcola]